MMSCTLASSAVYPLGELSEILDMYQCVDVVWQ